MKIIYLIFPIFFIVSCGGSTNTETSSNHVDTVQAFTVIDTNSPDGFIQSIKDFRLPEMASQSGYELNGNLIYEGIAGFKIFNFTESFDDYSLNSTFSIVLNPATDFNKMESEITALISISDFLREGGLNFLIYPGVFKSSLDFQADGSTDFILEDERMFRDNVFAFKQIILFDGQNQLTSTNIKAVSDYIPTEDGISGLMSELEFKEGKIPKIFITKKETVQVENAQGGMIDVLIEYTLNWQWKKGENENDSYWQTGVKVNNKKSESVLNSLNYRRTLLTEKNGEYVVEENCYRGEVNYFYLEKYTSAFDEYFIVHVNEDDIGTDFALAAIQTDENTTVILLGRIEDLSYNRDGHPAIVGVENKIIIRKGTINDGHEVEYIKWGEDGAERVYTKEPTIYVLVSCE